MSLKNILCTAIGLFFIAAPFAYAAPVINEFTNLAPRINDTYDLGTTSPALEWNNLYAKNITVSGTCSGCAGGGVLSATTTSREWVDSNRSDTYTANGAITTPWKSLSTAVTGLTSGFPAYNFDLSGGTYFEGSAININVPFYIQGNESTIIDNSGLTFSKPFDIFDTTFVTNGATIHAADPSLTSIHQWNNGVISTAGGLFQLDGNGILNNMTLGNGTVLSVSANAQTNVLSTVLLGPVNNYGQLNMVNNFLQYGTSTTYDVNATTTEWLPTGQFGGVNMGLMAIIATSTGGAINVQNGATSTANNFIALTGITGGASLTAGSAATTWCDSALYSLTGAFVFPTGTNWKPCWDENLNVINNFQYVGSATSTFSAGIEAPYIGTQYITATSTATSTFNGGVQVLNFSQTGTATSTFSNGLSLSGGCYSLPSGVCVGPGGATGGGSSMGVNWASTTTLPSNTYANGSSGIGATITEIGNGALYVDGNNPAIGDRVLVKNESTASHNGIYVVTVAGSGITAFVLTRALDYDSPIEITKGMTTYVVSGTTNTDSTWAVSFTSPLSVGSSNLTYTASAGAGSFTATYPIIITGTAISTAFGTTTNWGIGNDLLLYTSHTGIPQGIATTSLSASSPLTGSFAVVGSGGSIGCQTASGSQAGCLSSIDWTTFNLKLAPFNTNPLIIGYLVSTSSATSTHSGGIEAPGIGSPWFVATSTTATSTFNGGIKITGGGFSISNFTGTKCLDEINGVIFTTSSDCGSASGLSSYDAWTHPASGQSATTSTMIFTTGGLVINAASSTIQGNLQINGNSTTTSATTTAFAISSVTSALHLANSTGGVVAYGGTSCTNQFVRSLNGAGAATCNSVANADLTNSSLTYTAGTGLQGGGTVSLGGSAIISLLSYLATSSAETANDIPFWTTTGGTPAQLSGGNANLTFTTSGDTKFTTKDASTTNLTAGTSLGIPSSSNPSPVASGYITQSSNSPYQLHIGNGTASTIFDPRPAFILTVSSTTALTGTTTSPAFVIPYGLTVTNWTCTVQPGGATAEAEWQYANPTAYTTATPTYLAASTTPGNVAISANNTPASFATSTLSVGNPTGSALSTSCSFYGNTTAI